LVPEELLHLFSPYSPGAADLAGADLVGRGVVADEFIHCARADLEEFRALFYGQDF
jgi:hypothetical protein